jgi:hypothetical protein
VALVSSVVTITGHGIPADGSLKVQVYLIQRRCRLFGLRAPLLWVENAVAELATLDQRTSPGQRRYTVADVRAYEYGQTTLRSAADVYPRGLGVTWRQWEQVQRLVARAETACTRDRTARPSEYAVREELKRAGRVLAASKAPGEALVGTLAVMLSWYARSCEAYGLCALPFAEYVRHLLTAAREPAGGLWGVLGDLHAVPALMARLKPVARCRVWGTYEYLPAIRDHHARAEQARMAQPDGPPRPHLDIRQPPNRVRHRRPRIGQQC